MPFALSQIQQGLSDRHSVQPATDTHLIGGWIPFLSGGQCGFLENFLHSIPAPNPGIDDRTQPISVACEQSWPFVQSRIQRNNHRKRRSTCKLPQAEFGRRFFPEKNCNWGPIGGTSLFLPFSPVPGLLSREMKAKKAGIGQFVVQIQQVGQSEGRLSKCRVLTGSFGMGSFGIRSLRMGSLRMRSYIQLAAPLEIPIRNPDIRKSHWQESRHQYRGPFANSRATKNERDS